MPMINYFADFFTTGYLSRNITLIFFFLIILAARSVLSKFPARYRYMLWAVFAFKIIFDLSISAGSLQHMYSELHSYSAGTESDAFEGQDIVYNDAYSSAYEDMAVLSDAVQAADVTAAEKEVSVPDRISAFLSVLASYLSPWLFFVWIAGFLGMIVLGYVRYLKLINKIRVSVRIGRGLYSCDYIDSPIAVGFIRPGVYVPSGYDPEFLSPSIEHERIHIRRKDTLFKMLAYVLLAVYWMNPMAWISFKLFSLDMEISCDEMVLKNAGDSKIKKYAELLLYFASSGKAFDPASAAFGTTDIEKRVKNMKNKKMIGAVSALALMVVAAVVILSFVRIPGTDVQAAQSSETISDENSSAGDIVLAEEITGAEVSATAGEEVPAVSDGLNDAVSGSAEIPGVASSGDGSVNGTEVTAPEASEESYKEADEVDDAPVDLNNMDINPENLNAVEFQTSFTGKDGWVWPVQGESFITAGFGERTRYTENGEEKVMHPEVDIAAEPERTIVCAKDGIVSEADFKSDLGYYVVVKVSDEIYVTYSHLSEISVSAGSSVAAGTEIGKMGSTGRSTGPHLGFKVTINSVDVNPMQFYS